MNIFEDIVREVDVNQALDDLITTKSEAKQQAFEREKQKKQLELMEMQMLAQLNQQQPSNAEQTNGSNQNTNGGSNQTSGGGFNLSDREMMIGAGAVVGLILLMKM